MMRQCQRCGEDTVLKIQCTICADVVCGECAATGKRSRRCLLCISDGEYAMERSTRPQLRLRGELMLWAEDIRKLKEKLRNPRSHH